MTNDEIQIELRHLAAKEDLANLRADFHQALGINREDMANLRAELHKALATQLKWIIGLLIAQSGLLIAILHK